MLGRSILDAFCDLEHFWSILEQFFFFYSIIDGTIAFFEIATTMRFAIFLFDVVCVVSQPFFDHTFSLASIFGAF